MTTYVSLRSILEGVVCRMYRLSLIGTRSAAIPVATVPVGTAHGAAFAFLIAATANPIAAVTIPVVAMVIPVAAVHVETVPLAVVAVLARRPPTLALPSPLARQASCWTHGLVRGKHLPSP